jgi:hypothetical protein
MRKISTKRLKKTAWDLCSLYIRLKYADPDGNCECISCGNKYYWRTVKEGRTILIQGIQAGHLVPGRKLGILFDERGIFPQCYNCNIRLKGNVHEYVAGMVKEFGKEYTDNLIEELRRESKQPTKYNSTDYENLIILYEAHIKLHRTLKGL